jgi:hypothetical protein
MRAAIKLGLRPLSALSLVMSMMGFVSAVALAGVAATLIPAAPAFAQGACPNEQLRSENNSTQLPDCRAYELVTPPYQEGSPSGGVIFVAADGSSVLANNYGVLPGDEEDELHFDTPGALNGFSRASTGWSAVPLAFPASTYESKIEGVVDASSDAHSTLWELGPRTPEASNSEFYREAPAGVFSLVGPATPSTSPPNAEARGYSYAGASGDLSHALFEIFNPEFRWSFDTTLGRGASLYELAGVGNSAPALVGVLGAAGSTHLVSQCGTRLGSSTPNTLTGSMFNAISATGSRVFFTAVGVDDLACGGEQPPVDELLVREEAPSGTLSTTSISEPSPSYCASAPTPPCADAHFQGASQDGSKVFFTTAQKLSEGATEGSQNLYEYDFGLPGATQADKLVLLSAGGAPPGVEGVARISPDGSHVYFVASGVLTHTENAREELPTEGAPNLYVYERDAAVPDGRTTFIATLSPQDESDWSARDIRPVTVSSDGRFLVFLSGADPTHEGVQPTAAQVFQYDAQTGALVRASIGEHGYNGNDLTPAHAAALGQPALLAVFDRPGEDDQVLAPRNGAVFFQSPAALTPQALSGEKVNAIGLPIENVYEYRAGHVYLISDGKDASSSTGLPSVRLLGASASGEDGFFETADPLIQQDTNTQLDIYDARAGGGFPTPVAPATCTGDACQGAPTEAPVFGAPTSATLSGAGNLSPSPSATAGPKPKTAAQLRAKRLAIALKACRKKHSRRQRNACEHSARKRYPVKTATRHRGRGK